MKKLTKQDLSELLGGTILLASVAGDAVNKNTVAGCRCYYNDKPSATNQNTVDFCMCQCVWASALQDSVTSVQQPNVISVNQLFLK